MLLVTTSCVQIHFVTVNMPLLLSLEAWRLLDFRLIGSESFLPLKASSAGNVTGETGHGITTVIYFDSKDVLSSCLPSGCQSEDGRLGRDSPAGRPRVGSVDDMIRMAFSR
jgi:hypothetical protein